MDSAGIKKVLTKGDSLLVRGTTYVVKAVGLVRTYFGGVLLYYEADRPKPMKGWVRCEGTELIPWWAVGDELPGLAGVRIAGLPNFKGKLGPMLVHGDTAITMLEVSGAAYKKGLFRLTPGQAELVASIGRPDPVDPLKIVKDISPPSEGSANRFVFLLLHAYAKDWTESGVVLYDGGKLSALIKGLQWRKEADKVAWKLRYVSGEGPAYLLLKFRANRAGRDLGPSSMPSYFMGVRESTQTVTEYYTVATEAKLFDGERFIELKAENGRLGPKTDLRPVGGPRPGILIIAGGTSDAFGFTGGDESGAWFLDSAVPEAGLQPVPEIETESGQRISLSGITWISSMEGLVQLKDVYYILSAKSVTRH